MRTLISTPLLAAALASLHGTAKPASAQSPAPSAAPAAAPRPAVWDRTAVTAPRAGSATAAAYWGPSAAVAPKRKPNAFRRVFNRIGSFLGADEEMGTSPTFRDPTTGRTNPGNSKPWMSPAGK